MWYRNKLAELTEGIRRLINRKWTKIEFRGWKGRNRQGAGYSYRVSLADYSPGSEPRVGVTSSASGALFFVLQDSRSNRRNKVKKKMRWDCGNRGRLLRADTETASPPMKMWHLLFIWRHLLHLKRLVTKATTSCEIRNFQIRRWKTTFFFL